MSVSAKTADFIVLNRSWQNAVIFLIHSELAQESTTKQVETVILQQRYQVQFHKKQTRLTMKHVSAVTTETKASLGCFAMLECTACRCCIQI